MLHISGSLFTSSVIWKMLELFLSKFMGFFISIVLARLLTPEDYGIIAITSVFLSLTDIFIQGGFNTALIQKECVDDIDYSTTFIFSMVTAILAYVILFVGAPCIADYYANNTLISVLRVLGIVLFLQAFSAVRMAKITREMRFKQLCKFNVIGGFLSGVLGIIAAYSGFGVWALVIQQISQQLVINVAMYIALDFKFKLIWSFTRFKEMLSFSCCVLVSSIFYYLGDNITNIIVGKVYTLDVLGILSKGDQLPRQISVYVFGAIGSVLLPTFASYQYDRNRLKTILRKVLSMTLYLIMPCMVGLFVCADSVIVVFFSDKWINSAGIQRWASIYYLVYPVTAIFSQLFYGIRKGYKRVMLEFIRLILMLFILIFTIKFINGTIYNLIMLRAFGSVAIMVLSMYMAINDINCSIKEIFQDILPIIALSIIMGIVISPVNFLTLPYLLKLLIQMTIGIVFYVIASKSLHFKEYIEIEHRIKDRITRLRGIIR